MGKKLLSDEIRGMLLSIRMARAIKLGWMPCKKLEYNNKKVIRYVLDRKI